jgi:hypothetical protein
MQVQGEPMTEAERKMLLELDDMVKELHRAFMVAPAGTKTTLIEDIRTVSDAYQKGSWGIRFMLWVLPSAGVLVIYWEKLLSFVKG